MEAQGTDIYVEQWEYQVLQLCIQGLLIAAQVIIGVTNDAG
jgi:hypothetical protein